MVFKLNSSGSRLRCQPISEGANLLFGRLFPEMAWKWKKMDWEEGARLWQPPLDPMPKVIYFSSSVLQASSYVT